MSRPRYHDHPEADLIEVLQVADDLFSSHPEIFNLDTLPRGTAGEFHEKKWRISISYRHDIISVLVHEILHLMYPRWSETKVLWHEAYLMRQMTAAQATKLLKQFAQVI